MLSLTFIIVFIFCLAIAVASILISHQFITTYNTEFHRNYFYYLVTFFSFSFYGIWAQIIMRALLSSIRTGNEVVEIVANFLPVLGIPFLFISWIMLLKMGYSLVEIRIKNNVSVIHFTFLVIIMLLAWILYAFLDNNNWLTGERLTYAEIGLMMFLELASMILFAIVVSVHIYKILSPNKQIVTRFVLLMFVGLILRGTALIFSFANPWILAVVILLFFMSNFPPLFYMKINADLIFKPIHADNTNREKMELIFKKYYISKREKEIVQEICEGKTNQQIADELFISLQTVKDHTHRIYSKIGINSRMKLVQLVTN